MCFFKKKLTREQTVTNDLSTLKDFVGEIDVLIEMATNADVKKTLEDFKDKLTYANPSANREALNVSKKIENAIGDLKILLSSGRSDEKIAKQLENIGLLIKERESKS